MRDLEKIIAMWLLAGALLLGPISPFYLGYRLTALKRIRPNIKPSNQRAFYVAAVLCMSGLAYSAWFLIQFFVNFNQSSANGMADGYGFLIYFAFSFVWLLPLDVIVEIVYRLVLRGLIRLPIAT